MIALAKPVLILEAVIVVAIVGLLVGILLMNQRKKKGGKTPATAGPAPNYYADLQQQTTGQQDPFAAFGSGSVAPSAPPMANAAPPQAMVPNGAPAPAMPNAVPAGVPAPAFQAPPAPPPPPQPAAPAVPAPGTPAGWLQDPSGAPDTLRYWDGNAWTQHVAQRA